MNFLSSNRFIFVVDDSDSCIVGHWTWRVNNAGYAQRGVRKNGSTSSVLLHRLIWEKHNGSIPKDKEIHHADQDKLNNSITNLQLVTRRFNIVESKPNSLGYSGVTKAYDKPRNKPYKARVRIGGRNKWLGYFTTPEEAHQAYLNAVSQLES